jgi:sec-independent protein translocase protein TatA
MPTIGPRELIVVLVIALAVLGPKRLPEAGRGIGRGLREFKDAIGGREQVAERSGQIAAGDVLVAAEPAPKQTKPAAVA